MSEVTSLIGTDGVKSEPDASYPITKMDRDGKVPIAEIEVRSHEQLRLSLGSYTATKPPKGFAMHLTPSPQDNDAINAQITRVPDESSDNYELVLHVANYDTTTVSVEIWEL